VPSTISSEVQQYLASSAAGLGPFGKVHFGSTKESQAAAVAELRCYFPSALTNLSAAAEAQYIGSKRNERIGGVPVVIAVPKGVQESAPANTKVLLFLHGKFPGCLLSTSRECTRCIIQPLNASPSQCQLQAHHAAHFVQSGLVSPCSNKFCFGV
jgi:hypothetical protein